MGLLVKIVFLSCALTASASPLTKAEKQAMFGELVVKCKNAEGATDADMQEAKAHKAPTTRAGQCFHACMMESLGIMVGNKLSAEGCVKLAEMSGGGDTIKNSEVIANDCLSVGGGDRCDSAAVIFDCVAAASAKLGIDPTKDL